MSEDLCARRLCSFSRLFSLFDFSFASSSCSIVVGNIFGGRYLPSPSSSSPSPPSLRPTKAAGFGLNWRLSPPAAPLSLTTLRSFSIWRVSGREEKTEFVSNSYFCEIKNSNPSRVRQHICNIAQSLRCSIKSLHGRAAVSGTFSGHAVKHFSSPRQHSVGIYFARERITHQNERIWTNNVGNKKNIPDTATSYRSVEVFRCTNESRPIASPPGGLWSIFLPISSTNKIRDLCNNSIEECT